MTAGLVNMLIDRLIANLGWQYWPHEETSVFKVYGLRLYMEMQKCIQ